MFNICLKRGINIKKIWMLLLIIGLIAMVTGCKTAADNGNPQNISLTPGAVSDSDIQYTEDDIIRYFKSFSYSQNCVATDCVLTQDNAYGLIGIVQYTDENGNPCNLSFVRDSSFGYPVGLDADGRMTIADDSALSYEGSGTVTLTLHEKETGKSYEYTVGYSYSQENSETHFDVSSKERI